MGKGQQQAEPVREHYTFALSLRLSKNFNSMEARIEYGRDARDGEDVDDLVADVESIVKSRLNDATKQIDKSLKGL